MSGIVLKQLQESSFQILICHNNPMKSVLLLILFAEEEMEWQRNKAAFPNLLNEWAAEPRPRQAD